MERRSSVFSNLLWRFGERAGAQIVSFFVTIVIARILDPEAYGLIALVNIFIDFADVLIASGFGSAVIQKKAADELDYSSAFYFQLVVSLTLYVVLYFAAPSIQVFFGSDYEQLPLVIRVLGIRLFFVALNSMQNAYTAKHMQYRKFFFATIIGTIASAVVGISAAYMGLGVWALVFQYMTNSIIDTIVLWIIVDWRPRLIFSFQRLKQLYAFSWKLLAAALIDIAYQKARDLLIGKKYSPSDLAYYNRGSAYPSIIVKNINTSIDNVLFSVMSKTQDNIQTIKAMVQRSIRVSSYLICPMMMGLAVCGNSIVKLMLTDKWLPAVPYLQIFCVIYALQPINTASINAIKALGRSDLYLKLGILKDLVGVLSIVLTLRFGVFWIAFSGVIAGIAGLVINAVPIKRLIGYGYLEQLKDVMPATMLSIMMGLIVALVGIVKASEITKLMLQIPTGILVYVGLSCLFKNDSFSYIYATVKELIRHK